MNDREVEFEEWCAALHEAAHAVVAQVCGYQVTEVTAGDLGGLTRYRVPAWEADSPAGRRRMLAVTLAGWVADCRAHGREELIEERNREILDLAADPVELEEWLGHCRAGGFTSMGYKPALSETEALLAETAAAAS